MSDEALMRELWTNIQSGHVYRPVRVGNDHGRIIEVTRMAGGDGRTFTLSLARFVTKYRVATRDDVAALAPTMQTEDDDDQTPVGFVVEPDCRHDFNRIVLWPETTMSIRVGMNKVVRREAIERVFRLSQIEPRTRRSVLNFYGPPGTGKTLCAVAVARQLGVSLYQVDYSQIISKYIGDTAKHIKAAFDEARRLGAVLFWDEADSLLSRRVGMGEGADRSFSTSINQNRNVMMQELDRFDGVVIMCTNLFGNYDEAFVRRIAQHVQFKLPSPEMRRQLFDVHLPARDRVQVTDWDRVIASTDGFSGGDILNVIINVISQVALHDDESQWIIRDENLIAEATAIRNAKHVNGSSSNTAAS